ncbi:MAG: hypothetical protein NY202_03195 [Mollicutes bacterium UO1]
MNKKKLKKAREEQKQKLHEWIKQMGGKVPEKVAKKPTSEESKNSLSTKSTLLSSGIFTHNLVRILEQAHQYQETVVIASRGEGKT